MDRKQKITRLKAIMEGNAKALQDQCLFWQQDQDGFYQCETAPYTHLRFTKDNLTKFQDKFGGKHILFEEYSDDRDEPIEESTDNKIIWREAKTYEKPEVINVQVIAPETESENLHKVDKQEKPTQQSHVPKQKPNPKKKRTQREVHKVIIDTKAKEKAAYQKMLEEQQADKEKWERIKQLNRANQDLNNSLYGLF